MKECLREVPTAVVKPFLVFEGDKRTAGFFAELGVKRSWRIAALTIRAKRGEGYGARRDADACKLMHVQFIVHTDLGIPPVALGPNLELVCTMSRLVRSLFRRARAEARIAAQWRRFLARRAADAAAAAAAAPSPPPLSETEEHYAKQKWDVALWVSKEICLPTARPLLH